VLARTVAGGLKSPLPIQFRVSGVREQADQSGPGQEQGFAAGFPTALLLLQVELLVWALWALWALWVSRGLAPNGVDFLAKGAAGRAKLLLSRIPAASAAPIPAAP
jgi:hypothetical protein